MSSKSTAQLYAERLAARRPAEPDLRPSWVRHADRLRPATETADTTTEETR